MPCSHPFDLTLLRDHRCLLHLLDLLQEEFDFGFQALLVFLELKYLLPKLVQLLCRFYKLFLVRGHGSKSRYLRLKLLDTGCGSIKRPLQVLRVGGWTGALGESDL